MQDEILGKIDQLLEILQPTNKKTTEEVGVYDVILEDCITGITAAKNIYVKDKTALKANLFKTFAEIFAFHKEIKEIALKLQRKIMQLQEENIDKTMLNDAALIEQYIEEIKIMLVIKKIDFEMQIIENPNVFWLLQACKESVIHSIIALGNIDLLDLHGKGRAILISIRKNESQESIWHEKINKIIEFMQNEKERQYNAGNIKLPGLIKEGKYGLFTKAVVNSYHQSRNGDTNNPSKGTEDPTVKRGKKI